MSIDRSKSIWNLKNINIVEGSRKVSNLASNFHSDSVNDLKSDLKESSGAAIGIRMNKRRSSSTSYLNEEDDYDNDLNKLEYLKKFKRQLSLELLESKGSKDLTVTGLNGSISEDLNMDSNTKEAIDALNISSDSESNSGISYDN